MVRYQDMLSASHQDWVLMSHSAYQLLAAKVDHVVLFGFSTGAVLALELMQDSAQHQVSGFDLGGTSCINEIMGTTESMVEEV